MIYYRFTYIVIYLLVTDKYYLAPKAREKRE